MCFSPHHLSFADPEPVGLLLSRASCSTQLYFNHSIISFLCPFILLKIQKIKNPNSITLFFLMQFLNLCKFKLKSIFCLLLNYIWSTCFLIITTNQKRMQDLAIPYAQPCEICADPFFLSVRGSFNDRTLTCSVKQPAPFCAV